MTVITDWGTAIWTSLTGALALLLSFIPKLVGFLVILIIGLIVASLVAKAVTFLLKRIGFDRFSDRVGLTRLEQRMNLRMDTADILGRIVYWFIFLIFLIPAVDALGLTTISTLLSQVIAYIPNVFVAVLVLFLGTLAAVFVSDIVRGAMASANVGNANIFAAISKYAILGFAALIALEQLRIAESLLNILFTALVGALALAFGLAFGLGGRESAQRWLARGESRLEMATTQTGRSQMTSQPDGTTESSGRSSMRSGYAPVQDGAGINAQEYRPR